MAQNQMIPASHENPASHAGLMAIDIEQRGAVCILRCRGRLVAGPDIEYLQVRLEDLKRRKCDRVLADLRDVTSIGSMGIAFLVAIYTSVVQNSGGRFIVAGATPFVRHVLEIARLNTLIPLAADLGSAWAALTGEVPSGV